MQRRYYRQYENFDNIVPKSDDFPIISNITNKTQTELQNTSNANTFGIDDIILLAILVLLLSEEEKDITSILGIAFLFLAEYIL